MQVSYWNPATCPILNFPPDLHWPDLQKTLPPKNTGWLWPPNAENMSDWAWRLGGVKNEMNVLRPSKDCWCYWFHPKLRIYVLETRKNLDEYRICFHRSARCSAHRCLPVGNGSEHGRPVAAQRWRGEGTKWPVDGTTGGWFAELTIEHGVKFYLAIENSFFCQLGVSEIGLHPTFRGKLVISHD